MENIKSKSYECCIVGAGPAGLGAALELTARGITNILIIDKNVSIGGLSRTDVFNGVRFSLGPHRFFTKNKEVNKIWHDTLGKDFKSVSRLTRIFYKKRYFNYPIKPLDVLVKLGPIESLQVIFSFIASQGHRRYQAATFEDWIIQKFGYKLYKIFFKTYTEKIWGIPCNQIGVGWAAQRIKGLDALSVIKNYLLGGKNNKIKTLVEQFNYPVLGAGQMYEVMCNNIVSRGAELMLASKVVSFNREGDMIKSIDIIQSDSRKINIAARQFFSSTPLLHFFRMLDPPVSLLIHNAAEMLKYRDHITVNLLIAAQGLFPDQWIYVHSADVQMARVTNHNNFSKAMVGSEHKTALSVEYFVYIGEGLWNETNESLIDLAVNELDKMGLIKKTTVENAWVVRETEAYPLYYIGFQEYYNILKSSINQFKNIYSIGRAGMHKYNNQDHSLMSGILAARNYLKLPGSPYVLWDINIDAEYQEGAQRTTE